MKERREREKREIEGREESRMQGGRRKDQSFSVEKVNPLSPIHFNTFYSVSTRTDRISVVDGVELQSEPMFGPLRVNWIRRSQ